MTQRHFAFALTPARLASVATLAAFALPVGAQTAPTAPVAIVQPTNDAQAEEQAQAARDLAQAAFARPEARPAPAPTPLPSTPAGQVAEEAAQAKAAAPAELKPEWRSGAGVRFGGRGLLFRAPF
jgi:hypothetical protein